MIEALEVRKTFRVPPPRAPSQTMSAPTPSGAALGQLSFSAVVVSCLTGKRPPSEPTTLQRMSPPSDHVTSASLPRLASPAGSMFGAAVNVRRVVVRGLPSGASARARSLVESW